MPLPHAVEPLRIQVVLPTIQLQAPPRLRRSFFPVLLCYHIHAALPGGFQALDLFFFIRQPDDGIPIGPFSDHLFTSQNFSITIDTSINRKETTARITGLRVFMMAQKNPIVTITMEDGSIMKAELYPDIAPESVNNFISLIKKHFYDGVIFHRVIQNFMIQGGDPEGTGCGGPGYCIKGEFKSNGFQNDLKHTEGVLSMARTMIPDSAGSQFFIMHKTSPHLDGEYAAFGKIIEGMETVNAIAKTATNYADRPLQDQRIKTMTVDTFGVDYPEPNKLKER